MCLFYTDKLVRGHDPSTPELTQPVRTDLPLVGTRQCHVILKYCFDRFFFLPFLFITLN